VCAEKQRACRSESYDANPSHACPCRVPRESRVSSIRRPGNSAGAPQGTEGRKETAEEGSRRLAEAVLHGALQSLLRGSNVHLSGVAPQETPERTTTGHESAEQGSGLEKAVSSVVPEPAEVERPATMNAVEVEQTSTDEGNILGDACYPAASGRSTDLVASSLVRPHAPPATLVPLAKQPRAFSPDAAQKLSFCWSTTPAPPPTASEVAAHQHAALNPRNSLPPYLRKGSGKTSSFEGPECALLKAQVQVQATSEAPHGSERAHFHASLDQSQQHRAGGAITHSGAKHVHHPKSRMMAQLQDLGETLGLGEQPTPQDVARARFVGIMKRTSYLAVPKMRARLASGACVSAAHTAIWRETDLQENWEEKQEEQKAAEGELIVAIRASEARHAAAFAAEAASTLESLEAVLVCSPLVDGLVLASCRERDCSCFLDTRPDNQLHDHEMLDPLRSLARPALLLACHGLGGSLRAHAACMHTRSHSPHTVSLRVSRYVPFSLSFLPFTL
jgi:hypothetical protein